MTTKYIFPLLICVIFLAACARQTSPTGGPKDTIPPKLVSSNPKNEQTRFKGKTIDLEFTEMINLNSPKDQVIITPSIGKEFAITAKRNLVKIELNNAPDSNTTYTINFRDAIQDITEKNPVPNLKLAFSTGAYIDSLSISGTVTDIISSKEMKETTVALQQIHDTVNITKDPSLYFTKTNDKGQFKLDYLKPGTYQLYAFEDKNKNLVVDARNESYAFIAKPITLTKDTAKVSLHTLRLDVRTPKITSARPYNTYFNIKANKNLRSYTLVPTDPKIEISHFYGDDQSNVKVYNTFDQDSLQIKFVGTDSSGQTIDTTLYAKFRKEDNIRKEKFQTTVEEARITARTGLIKLVFSFNKPITFFNLDSIYFRKDTITTINFTKENVDYNPITNKFIITKTVDKKMFLKEEKDEEKFSPKARDTTAIKEPKQLNELILTKGVFTSIESDSSTALKQKITPEQPDNLSEIIYSVKTKKQNILVQLLTKDFKILRQEENSLSGSFKDLPPGDYIVRYVIDENGNKAWDPGNYIKRQEPERIYYAKDPKGSIIQSLKTNWELELAEMLITN